METSLFGPVFGPNVRAEPPRVIAWSTGIDIVSDEGDEHVIPALVLR
jgi:hypothetical protein